ncbi:hypothetical protein KIH87_05330 [Paraneptunicella aestuarii]|uniref:helix-turn-helix domain-containing protein n=1 Tax=Paraneptunicella aestuarii TaxID=2831148 RepID=UPI001E2A7A78|nr:helix-turn-helix transcriptional regulator [Paraneptunicella aestuarii]UAA39781.1 hypothetical protein KIH87_05330 [Paraneptunicella aestuarii]
MRKRKFPNDTQTRFAARIGVGVTTIRNLEAGKGGVAWETVVKALDILGMKNQLDALFVEPPEIKIKSGESW